MRNDISPVEGEEPTVGGGARHDQPPETQPSGGREDPQGPVARIHRYDLGIFSQKRGKNVFHIVIAQLLKGFVSILIPSHLF